jgi:hypothetical protein
LDRPRIVVNTRADLGFSGILLDSGMTAGLLTPYFLSTCICLAASLHSSLHSRSNDTSSMHNALGFESNIALLSPLVILMHKVVELGDPTMS